MSEDQDKTKKVTLDIELSDLLEVVSKMGGGASNAPISSISQQHAIEAEDLRKAWFKHVLISMEKLSDKIESVRGRELSGVKSELKNEIDKLDQRVTKGEEKLETYKTDVIKPLHDKLLSISVKIGVWAILAGFVGSGLLLLVGNFIQFILPILFGAPASGVPKIGP